MLLTTVYIFCRIHYYCYFEFQRSIRARKKLILPDYEYGFDSKTDNEDFLGLSSSKRSTPSTPHTFETSTPTTVTKVYTYFFKIC